MQNRIDTSDINALSPEVKNALESSLRALTTATNDLKKAEEDFNRDGSNFYIINSVRCARMSAQVAQIYVTYFIKHAPNLMQAEGYWSNKVQAINTDADNIINKASLLLEQLNPSDSKTTAVHSSSSGQADAGDFKQNTTHENRDFKSGEENSKTTINGTHLDINNYVAKHVAKMETRMDARIESFAADMRASIKAPMKAVGIKTESKSDAAPSSRHFWSPEFDSFYFKKESMLAVEKNIYAFVAANTIHFFDFSDMTKLSHLKSITHNGVTCITLVKEGVLASSSCNDVKIWDIEGILTNVEGSKPVKEYTYKTNPSASYNDTLLVFKNRYIVGVVTIRSSVTDIRLIGIYLTDTEATPSQPIKIVPLDINWKGESLDSAFLLPTGQLSLLITEIGIFSCPRSIRNYQIDPTQERWLQPLDPLKCPEYWSLNTRPLPTGKTYLAVGRNNDKSHISIFSPKSQPKILFDFNFDGMKSLITSTGDVYFVNGNWLYFAEMGKKEIEKIAKVNEWDKFCMTPSDELLQFSQSEQKIIIHTTETVRQRHQEVLQLKLDNYLPQLPAITNKIITDYAGHWLLFPANNATHHQLNLDCKSTINQIETELNTLTKFKKIIQPKTKLKPATKLEMEIELETITKPETKKEYDDKTINLDSTKQLLIDSKNHLEKFRELLQGNCQLSLEECIMKMENGSPTFLKDLQETQNTFPAIKFPVILTEKIALLEKAAKKRFN